MTVFQIAKTHFVFHAKWRLSTDVTSARMDGHQMQMEFAKKIVYSSIIIALYVT